MKTLLSVALGGAAGSVARYLIATWAAAALPGRFPAGILIANVAGSFLIGFLMTFFTRHPAAWPWRPLLIAGFLGGLTTFSSFAYDSAEAWREGLVSISLLNIGLNLGLGLAAVAAGLWLGERIP